MIISDLEHLEVFTEETSIVGGTCLDELISLLKHHLSDSIAAYISLPGIDNRLYAADEVTPAAFSASATTDTSLSGGVVSTSYSSKSSVA